MLFEATIAEEERRLETLRKKEESMDGKWKGDIIQMTKHSFQLHTKVRGVVREAVGTVTLHRSDLTARQTAEIV